MNHEHSYEKQLREAVKNAPLAQPSPDFVNRVMQRAELSGKIITYKPLISKKGWLVIVAVGILSVFLSYFYGTDLAFPKVLQVERLLSYNPLNFLNDIFLSKGVWYSLMAVPVMIWLQVSFLASWHKKQLQRHS